MRLTPVTSDWTRSWQLAAVSWQHLQTAYCKLPTAYCLLPTAYCKLPTANCLLQTATCSPSSLIPQHSALSTQHSSLRRYARRPDDFFPLGYFGGEEHGEFVHAAPGRLDALVEEALLQVGGSKRLDGLIAQPEITARGAPDGASSPYQDVAS